MFVLCANERTLTFWVLHLSSVLVIQQRRKGTRQHEINANISPVLRGRVVGVTQRRVGTCQGQQSPQCCSWLFPEWDLRPWVTCPADKHREGVRGQTNIWTVLGVCVHWSAANFWRMSVCYLEDFCLTWVGVCVLFSRWLGVMLILPLGPDLTGATLELGSALTAFPRHI